MLRMYAFVPPETRGAWLNRAVSGVETANSKACVDHGRPFPRKRNAVSGTPSLGAVGDARLGGGRRAGAYDLADAGCDRLPRIRRQTRSGRAPGRKRCKRRPRAGGGIPALDAARARLFRVRGAVGARAF